MHPPLHLADTLLTSRNGIAQALKNLEMHEKAERSDSPFRSTTGK